MGINLFQKKRKEANMSKTDMAIELGVPFGVYEEIEKGERKMPTKLVDSFNKITTEAKKNKNITKMKNAQQQQIVNDFFEEVIANDREKLKDLMKKFNIKSFTELSVLLNYNSTVVSHYTSSRTDLAGYEFKSKLYNFFQDELNIQTSKKEVKKGGKKSNRVYYSKKDYEALCDAIREKNYHNISAFAKEVNIDPSTMSNLKKFGFISATTHNKIWDYLNSLNKEEIIETKEEEVPTMCEETKDIMNFSEVPAPIEQEITLEELEEQLENSFEQTSNLTAKVMKKREEEKKKKEMEMVTKEIKLLLQSLRESGFSEENAQFIAREIILKSIDNK